MWRGPRVTCTAANGISEEYHVIRHMVNLETVNTYEGTHDVTPSFWAGAGREFRRLCKAAPPSQYT